MDEVMVFSSPEAETEFNSYVAIRDQLTANLDFYHNLVVDEDSYMSCKADQQKLAGVRRKVDAFRKAEKKRMEAPIKVFEDECKDLMNVIQDAEDCLLEGTNVYDDKRRAEKKAYAESEIAKAAASFALEPEFADRLTVKDSYCNLSTTKKAVREAIEADALELKAAQDKRHADLKEIDDAVAGKNTDLGDTLLDVPEFEKMYLAGKTTDEVIAAIDERVDQIIRAQEAAVERERKAAEEREAAKERERERKTAQEETVILTPPQAVSGNKVPEPDVREAQINTPPASVYSAPAPKSVIWTVSLEVEGPASVLSSLQRYMQDNGITFRVNSQIPKKEGYHG